MSLWKKLLNLFACGYLPQDPEPATIPKIRNITDPDVFLKASILRNIHLTNVMLNPEQADENFLVGCLFSSLHQQNVECSMSVSNMAAHRLRSYQRTVSFQLHCRQKEQRAIFEYPTPNLLLESVPDAFWSDSRRYINVLIEATDINDLNFEAKVAVRDARLVSVHPKGNEIIYTFTGTGFSA